MSKTAWRFFCGFLQQEQWLNQMAEQGWWLVKLRFYAVGKSKLATSPGSINQELLIVDKPSDGRLFALHSANEDKLQYYRHQRRAYGAALVNYQRIIGRLKAERVINEWRD